MNDKEQEASELFEAWELIAFELKAAREERDRLRDLGNKASCRFENAKIAEGKAWALLARVREET